MPSIMSSKPKWKGDSEYSEQDSRFSRLEEMDDLQPYGHGVRVHAGGKPKASDAREDAGNPHTMAVPSSRIGVKTDVVVETIERPAYNDRLY